MNTEINLKGACACGEIQYECLGAPLAMFNCHCGQCQLASGGTFVSAALVEEASLSIRSGKVKYFRSVGDAGRWTDRGFCGECGTPMFAKGEIAVGLISIKPGTLHDKTLFKPTIDTWATSAPAWLHLDSSIPKADKTPNLLNHKK
jgi:hypothetical protein